MATGMNWYHCSTSESELVNTADPHPFTVYKVNFSIFPHLMLTHHHLLFTDQTLRDKGLRNFPRVFTLSTGSTSPTDIKSQTVFLETPRLTPPLTGSTPRAPKWMHLPRAPSLPCSPVLTLWELTHPDVYPAPCPSALPSPAASSCLSASEHTSAWPLFCALEF